LPGFQFWPNEPTARTRCQYADTSEAANAANPPSIFRQLLDRCDNAKQVASVRDSAGQPRIVLSYSIGEYEKRAFASNHQLFDKLIAALGAREFERSGSFSRHHLMGTLRMGREARASVVDPFCRAHDHPNLFVAGSAVFPTGGTASPTLTIAALALRTADAITRQMQQ
jgi:glucose dehydrogenase